MEPIIEKVFGVGDSDLLSYLERPQVNKVFLDSLNVPKHIIIYGASKQGKSSLRTRHLDTSRCVISNPGRNTTLGDMYSSIIRQENIPTRIVLEHGTRKKILRTAELSISGGVPIIRGKGEVSGSKESTDSSKCEISHADYNLNQAQDVCELLNKINFDKFIVLENFHYLKDAIQRDLAIDLRIFSDYGIRFIILGIWRERNRLGQYNGDLLDRMKEIPVDPWESEDLNKVGKLGTEALNISINAGILKKINDISFGSIGVYQELCKEYCIANGITERRETIIEISDERAFGKAIERKVRDYGERHISALRIFVQKSQKDERPQPSMSYYLVRAILESGFDEVVNGLSRSYIEGKIKELYLKSQKFSKAELGGLLHSISKFQTHRKIWPPLFDYDQTSRQLRIIDSTLFFYLKHARTKIIEDISDSALAYKQR